MDCPSNINEINFQSITQVNKIFCNFDDKNFYFRLDSVLSPRQIVLL